MPSKLLILHGEAKSYYFTVSCVPKVCSFIFGIFTVISFASTCSKYNLIAKHWYMNKNGVADQGPLRRVFDGSNALRMLWRLPLLHLPGSVTCPLFARSGTVRVHKQCNDPQYWIGVHCTNTGPLSLLLRVGVEIYLTWQLLSLITSPS